MTASADVQSANIVGYSSINVPVNKSLITPVFKNVADGSALDLLDIEVLNDENKPFVKGPKTQCAGTVTAQRLTSNTGKYAETYVYWYPGSGEKVGWCDVSGKPVARDAVKLTDGEGLLVVNNWKKDSVATPVNFRCNGEVDLLGQNAIPVNKSISGNALPRQLDLTEIGVLNNEKQPFVKGPKTQCAGTVTLQKLDNETGKYGTTYVYWYPGSGTKVGWCDVSGNPVKVGDVTFEQGEAMLVVNNWKNDGVASIVYFDLPDPLTPMPKPEK